MLGAIIGAATSALGSIGNALSTSKANKRLRSKLEGQQAGTNGDAIADRYGDWRYSGANLYFNKAAEEMKDYVAQQRAARNVTGAVDNGSAVKAAAKSIGDAAGQANAQRQAVGMQMYQQDKQRANAIGDQINELDAKQSAAMTQAWSQLGQTAGNLATSLGNSLGSKASAKTASKASAKTAAETAAETASKPITQSPNTTIDFNRALVDVDYQKDIKKQIMGGL